MLHSSLSGDVARAQGLLRRLGRIHYDRAAARIGAGNGDCWYRGFKEALGMCVFPLVHANFTS